MESKINVLIVKEDSAASRNLEYTISEQADMHCVGSAHSVSEAQRHLEKTTPDVVLLDLVLPDGDGYALVSELWQQSSPVSTLIASELQDEESVIRAMEAGAQGYVLENRSSADLVDAIRTVHAGGSPLCPSIAKHLFNYLSSAKSQATQQDLSSREKEILRLVAQGLSTKKTAEVLFISTHTANTHVKNIFAKLAVKNRAQATIQARLLGLV